MKKFNNIAMIGIFVLTVSLLLTGCSKNKEKIEAPDTNNQEEIVKTENNQLGENVTITTLGDDYELKQFDICEKESESGNTYTFLRFKNPPVSSNKGNTYFSANKISSDMYVTIVEDLDKTMDEVLDEATAYIKNNITKEQSGEGENIAYRTIKYDFNEYKKVKFIVCLKTDTGYLVHDFSFYESEVTSENELIKECLYDMFTVFGLSVEE